jgi:hypothetical protein
MHVNRICYESQIKLNNEHFMSNFPGTKNDRQKYISLVGMEDMRKERQMHCTSQKGG